MKASKSADDGTEPASAAVQESFKLLTIRYLRVAPQQPRAWQTVERLIDAANQMMLSARPFEEFSLEAAASEAGVTPQSAYRYFANIEDLVRTSVRIKQWNWNTRFLAFMLEQAFESELEVAQAVAKFISDTYATQVDASGKVKLRVLRNYHDLDFDSAWTLAQALVPSLSGARGRLLRLTVPDMAVGLTSLWAVAKLLILGNGVQLAQPDTQRMMASMFLSALSSTQSEI
jgi:AcrR family transcriptional regulator